MTTRSAAALSAKSDARPWDSPRCRARDRRNLERKVRRVFGDKTVGEWRRILKAYGLWKD